MSERKLVYKVTIDDIEPLPEADRLEVARVGGWRIVTQKAQFHAGDVALYFEIDSALNPHDDRFAFLRDRCYKKFNTPSGALFDECFRIRTMKLRGVVSQGLLMPCEQFCEVRNKKLGEDCADVLYVRHYDEVAERAAREQGALKPTNQKGSFPDCIPKTDEERVQNLDDQFFQDNYDVLFEVTEKRDGTSMTIAYMPSVRPDDPVAVCSRNFELYDMPSSYWDIVHRDKLDEKLSEYCRRNNVEIALQGELTGPGIQSNRDSFESATFSIFRIWNIVEQRWLTWDERCIVCKDLGLTHVPIIDHVTLCTYDDAYGSYNIPDMRDNILAYAEGKTARGNEREGVVFKSVDGKIHFKAVSNRYLLGLK